MVNRLRTGHINLKETGLPQVPMIAIVDDDASVREATKGLVRSLGYRVATYGSAGEFLSSMGLHETSCLITDVQMPGFDGLELQSLLIAQGNRVPVIFITGFPEAHIRARAMEAGALGFLGKPFDDESLIACLDKALATDAAAVSRE